MTEAFLGETQPGTKTGKTKSLFAGLLVCNDADFRRRRRLPQ